jgi:hypothetical protein
MSCHDGVPGCAGGDSCPFFTQTVINGEILGSNAGSHTAADGTVTAIVTVLTILPRVITRFLSRGVLDFLKSVARRPRAGAAVDLAVMPLTDLVEAVRNGTVDPSDAIVHVTGQVAAAANATEVARLNGIATALSKLQDVKQSGASGYNGELLGAFTLAWTQAGRVVQQAQESAVVVAGAGDPSTDSSTERRAAMTAKILRPRSEHEFFYMLQVWMMICHATGLANTLATGAFTLQVVHQQISLHRMSWQQAHELFLVYLEAVETAPVTSDLTIANVYASGAQDMYRERAAQRSKDHFKPSPSGPPSPGGGGIFRFNGQHTPTATRCCVTFNLGKSEHPTSSLDPAGKCKYAHKCDHWVAKQPDGTPGGRCGGGHPRIKCTNPEKCEAPIKGGN